jgi:hypothetical protein
VLGRRHAGGVEADLELSAAVHAPRLLAEAVIKIVAHLGAGLAPGLDGHGVHVKIHRGVDRQLERLDAAGDVRLDEAAGWTAIALDAAALRPAPAHVLVPLGRALRLGGRARDRRALGRARGRVDARDGEVAEERAINRVEDNIHALIIIVALELVLFLPTRLIVVAVAADRRRAGGLVRPSAVRTIDGVKVAGGAGGALRADSTLPVEQEIELVHVLVVRVVHRGREAVACRDAAHPI